MGLNANYKDAAFSLLLRLRVSSERRSALPGDCSAQALQ